MNTHKNIRENGRKRNRWEAVLIIITLKFFVVTRYSFLQVCYFSLRNLPGTAYSKE